MSNFLLLIKIQFLSVFGINKIANRKKGKSKGLMGIVSLAILFAGIIVAVGYLYAKMFAEMYIALGQPSKFLPTIFAICSVICLIFSFYSSSGNIYSAKDYELLSAMPIKTHTIVLSKLMFTYIADLLFAILVMVPAVFVHFDMIGSIATLSLLRLFLMTLALPIYPMIFSIVLGIVVSYISSKFRRKALVQSLIYFGIFIACYALALIGTNLADTLAPVRNMYFLLPWVESGMSDFLFVGLFVGVGIVLISLAIFVVSITYNKLNTILKSVKRANKYTLKEAKKNSQFKALAKKEFKFLFSTPIYAMNTLMGSVMMIVGSVVLTVITISNNAQQMAMMFAIILQPLCAFSLMLSPTTAVGLSVEGSCFYIMRTTPISTKNLLNAKLFVNFVVAVIPALVGGIVFSLALSLAPWEIVVFTILNAPLYAALGGNIGLIFNLLFPCMKWDNIMKPVKQSLSLVFTIVIGMATAGGIFAFIYFVTGLSLEIKFLIIFAFLLVMSILTYALIIRYGEKLIIKKIG